MLRVAAYCRVSTDQEDQANSFASQKRYFLECIERNPDWELQGIYADEGLSGTNTKKRRQFHRMIQAARDGKIDLIITKEVSRFARNTLDMLDYTRELRSRGIGVIFLIDSINTLDHDGELRLTILSSIAQEESRKTSERVKWGQMRSMERGVVFGRSMLGYDVSEGKMTINPEGAKIVQSIFHRYLNEQKGSSVIAKELCEEGVLSSRGTVRWTASIILKILKNEKYCGDLLQKKTYTPDYLSHDKKYNKGAEEKVMIRDHHPAIIERTTWEAVQREMRRRNHHRTGNNGHGNRYPLSGKIRCGECGHTFSARMKYTANPYRIWRCGNASANGSLHRDSSGELRGCDVGRQLRDDTAMDLLKQVIATIPINADAVIENLTQILEAVRYEKQEHHGSELLQLEQEFEQVEEKKQRALEAFLDGRISKTDLQFMNQRCDSQLSRIQGRIDSIQKCTALEINPDQTTRDVTAAIRGLIHGDHIDGEFYGRLLDHMTVYRDGRIEVVLSQLPVKWIWGLPTRSSSTAPGSGSS